MGADFDAWDWLPTPNKWKGRSKGKVAGVVQHYTAAGSGRALAKWIATPESKVSAHVIICRDGRVIQQVRFVDRAWHAGTRPGRGDFWLGDEDPPVNVNHISIGIENSNYGALKLESGVFVTPYGKTYKGPTPVEGEDHNGITRFWEPYTEELIEANVRVLRRWCEWAAATPAYAEYPRRSMVTGHSDVSPRRKMDPGPAFPMKYILDEVFGVEGDPMVRDVRHLGSDPDTADDYETMFSHRYDTDAQMCLIDEE